MDRDLHDGKASRGNIEFEWYSPKAQSNLRKHQVSFEEASTIFGDEKILDLADSQHSEEEMRYIGIGRSVKGRILFVNFTVRGDKIRIISARHAEPWERREYEIADRDE